MFNVDEISAVELQERLVRGDKLRLIDVRSHEEFAQAMIAGAELMPLPTLPSRVTEFDENEAIVFYCRSGSRSAQACLFLQQNRGIAALNLRGGIISWCQSGQKVVTSSVAA